MKVKISFLGGVVGDGADVNLTKSSTMLRVRNGKEESTVLVDCGLWQGKKELFIRRNKNFSFNPLLIDGVILTHAHIDHNGRLPILIQKGFGEHNGRGRIFATGSSRDITEIMLFDAEKINALEVKKAKRRAKKEKEPLSGRRWKKALEKRILKMDRDEADQFMDEIEKLKRKKKMEGWEVQLFNKADVKKSMTLFKCHDYGPLFFKVAKDIYAKFYPSGHVLGGAICVIRIDRAIEGENKPIYIGFSGDLGRRDGIILPAPKLVQEPLDYWITESTYGAMNHPRRRDELKRFLELVEVCKRNKSKIMIPSFALERTQELVYLLSYHMHKKNIPKVPIYLDSPLALKIMEVYAEQWYTPMFKDQDMLDFNPFDLEENKYIRIVESHQQSQSLAYKKGPAIVIAGSGMADAGRIRNHLKAGLSDRNNIVCIVGYAVPNTPGRKLVDREPSIVMDGLVISNNARMEKFGSFSAHADQEYLTHYTQEIIRKSPNLKKIFINHGGLKNGWGLKDYLLGKLPYTWQEKIIIPKAEEEFLLN